MSRELIERLERLKEPDPYLDESIRDLFWEPTIDCAVATYNYTRSLDAAIALVERVLPGWQWLVESDGTAAVHTGIGKYAKGATPAIALLIALLNAKDTP